MPNVAAGAGHVQAPLGVAKIDLHVDDNEMNLLLVGGGGGQAGVLGIGGDSGYIGVKQAADTVGIVDIGKFAHGFLSPLQLKCINYTNIIACQSPFIKGQKIKTASG